MDKHAMRLKLFKDGSKNRIFYIAGLALIISIITVAIVRVATNKLGNVDWLNQADWSHFSGAEKISDGIRILPTGRAMNHRDTSTTQSNPPVNSRG